MDNACISRYKTSQGEGFESGNLDDDKYSNDYRCVITKGAQKSWSGAPYTHLREPLMINHLHDYALKKYYKMSLGVDFSENSFLLGNNVLDYSSVQAGKVGAQSGLQAQFDLLASKATTLYPAANLDPALASELFRVISLIRGSNPYDCGNKMKRVFYPRMFDRVFSILVNEKDFIIHNDSLSKEFLDIYKSEPNFSMTAEIERPDIKDPPGIESTIRTNRKTLSNTNDIGTVTKKYKASTFDDYPEVYSYYVNISLIKKGRGN